MAAAPPPKRPIKVLMLHGFTQSGPLFHAKTRALEKNLQKAFPSGISLVYPTAPIRLSPADVPFPVATTTNGDANGAEEETDAWAWWRRKGDAEPYTYEGIEQGLAHLASILQKEGPFDGVVGFSQGGAMAGMLASLLEPGRREGFEALYPKGGMRYPESFEADTGYVEEVIHPQLKFAVSYSGFAARGVDLYKGFYDPKITTPMLHFLGTLDAVVEETRSLALVEACDKSEGRVVYHPGGHFLPSSQKAYVSALIGFMKEVLHAADEGGKEKKEESVEDMDVPF
ncbi:dihydrofolate reductase [Lophiotrema nucula]|uniref:Dihydrofolate reductase n=1 Tax=Lophiotrema nucula TaxID=690887 RepID=A0A6A5YTB9_9PLEO|nr:dihydrofolate reductase [Lophiotrema nucula]